MVFDVMCGVVWCGVVWCGVVWCGVAWCVWCVRWVMLAVSVMVDDEKTKHHYCRRHTQIRSLFSPSQKKQLPANANVCSVLRSV